MGDLASQIEALVKEVKSSAGTNASKERTKAHVALAEVERFGDKLILPTKMTIDDAISVLERQKKYDDETVVMMREVPCFPWDGAIAMSQAMKEMFGWATAEPVKSFFGEQPPQIIQVEVGPNRKQGVAWGQFSLPGIKGLVATGVAMVGNPPVLHFKMTAKVRRVDGDAISTLFDRTEDIVRAHSIYRGQAIRIRFNGDDGEAVELPIPQFLDLSQVRTNQLVFSDDIETSVNTNLFTLLEYTKACREARVPLKRGILFEGPYGVGKSLAAYVTAKKATDNGWTYLYCERADELGAMVRFAHQYQPAVIFCEDIDRVVAGERSTSMDTILNIIDGIESKGTEIIIVLTTNFVGRINKAMLRPGRLDAIISVRPPDAQAVRRLVMQYSAGQLVINTAEDEQQFNEACNSLAGKVPAAVRECVERAKLSAIKLSNGLSTAITPQALLDSAVSMQAQFNIMAPNDKAKLIAATREEVIQHLGQQLVRSMLPGTKNLLNQLAVEGEDVDEQSGKSISIS